MNLFFTCWTGLVSPLWIFGHMVDPRNCECWESCCDWIMFLTPVDREEVEFLRKHDGESSRCNSWYQFWWSWWRNGQWSRWWRWPLTGCWAAWSHVDGTPVIFVPILSFRVTCTLKGTNFSDDVSAMSFEGHPHQTCVKCLMRLSTQALMFQLDL